MQVTYNILWWINVKLHIRSFEFFYTSYVIYFFTNKGMRLKKILVRKARNVRSRITYLKEQEIPSARELFGFMQCRHFVRAEGRGVPLSLWSCTRGHYIRRGHFPCYHKNVGSRVCLLVLVKQTDGCCQTGDL